MNHKYQAGLDQYRNLELQSKVEDASPHELINLLLQGARSHITSAKNSIQHQRIKEKGEHIGKAIAILNGLIGSLDHETGGEIATNLEALYQYIQQILLRANIDSSIVLLDEANALLGDIHQAWMTIKSSTAA